MYKILGISAFYHDSAAALLVDGKIAAAAQEERFTRKKHTSDFPINAIRFCLDYSGIRLNDLDAVVFYDKPFLKFERLLETYYEFAPLGLISFLKSIPVWAKEKLFLKKTIKEKLLSIEEFDIKRLNLLFSEHHLSHAGSAYYSSPFNEAAILTIDGVGEWATASIFIGKGNKIVKLKEMKYPHSIGLLYSAFTYFLGFKVNSGEYKLMGLAPYGISDSEETLKFINIIKDHLVEIKDDGSTWLNQDFFNYSTGLTMIKKIKWKELFGFPTKMPEEEIKQCHCNLAYAIQNVIEEIILKMVIETKRITGLKRLCYAGGVALNCVANTKLLNANIFSEIYIQPAAGDAGGALGAAQVANYIYFNQERSVVHNENIMQGTFLGPKYTDLDIKKALYKLGANFQFVDDFNNICSSVAELIAEGNIVGWFQGRMEFGPRALGNRSILGDARNPGMQKKLNLKIKKREGFRPFAPSILLEDYSKYFNELIESPFMLFNTTIIEEKRYVLPEDFKEKELLERLYFIRSDVPAITHLDFSSRVQTVTKEVNPKFWLLLNTFKSNTGCSLLINTSFNVRGEPIVCSPEDAYKCFMRTEMDYLVIGNYIIKKIDQPDPRNNDWWKETFEAD